MPSDLKKQKGVYPRELWTGSHPTVWGTLFPSETMERAQKLLGTEQEGSLGAGVPACVGRVHVWLGESLHGAP